MACMKASNHWSRRLSYIFLIILLTNLETAQDKRNCPFYIKTGVCRYGVRCSRIHPFVRDNACTLLMQSMYCGAGLSSESSDSLEVCVGCLVA